MNKSNNSSGSGSGSGSGDRGTTRVNLASDSGLNNFEYLIENNNKETSDNKRKLFFEERGGEVGTYIDIINTQKRPSKFKTSVKKMKKKII